MKIRIGLVKVNKNDVQLDGIMTGLTVFRIDMSEFQDTIKWIC